MADGTRTHAGGEYRGTCGYAAIDFTRFYSFSAPARPGFFPGFFPESIVIGRVFAYLTAYGTVIGVVKQVTSAGTTTTLVRFFHRDNLGSTTAVTDEAGNVIERLAYEAFGKRRFASGVVDPDNSIVPVNTERGFTNHEHIDELGLVHMNGRIYDPWIGRFVSADPFIQDPNNLQSYNRYSYVWNSPLNGTDPSGYFNLGKALGLDGLIRSVTHSQVGRIAVTVAVAYFTGYYQFSPGSYGIGGGKFANGAITASFGYLFNECLHGGKGCPFPKPLSNQGIQLDATNSKKMWGSSLSDEQKMQARMTELDALSTVTSYGSAAVGLVPGGQLLSVGLGVASLGFNAMKQGVVPNPRAFWADLALDSIVVDGSQRFGVPRILSQSIADGMKNTPEFRCMAASSC